MKRAPVARTPAQKYDEPAAQGISGLVSYFLK